MIVDIQRVRRRDRSLAGLGALYDTSPLNPTTIWMPSTGFLNSPGTLSQGYQNKPQVTSVYDVPGLLLSAPDCTQAAGGAFVSAACVDQALIVQQENFKRTAAYNAGTLQLPSVLAPPPPSTATPTSTQNQVNKQAPATQQNQMLSSAGGIMDTVSMASLGGDVSILGYQVPIWAIGIVAIGGLVLLSGGRH